MDMIYTFEQIDNIMDSISNYSIRESFIKKYINDLANKNEDNGESFRLYSTGVIANENEIRLEQEVTGSIDFFNFPNKIGNQSYIISSLENCIQIRNTMNAILLYI